MRQIALIVITDGRARYMAESMDSLRWALRPFPEAWFISDDSAVPDYRRWLRERFPDAVTVGASTRQGMAQNIALGWRTIVKNSAVDYEYVFHTEDDFIYSEPLDLKAMAAVLDANPRVAQLTLKREPVSPEEIAAGGQMETAPWLYADREGFVEHGRLFSCNPSLCRAEALKTALENGGADDPGGIERGVTDALLAAGYTFGYWGAREDPPRCTHIGHSRSPGYRW